MAIFIANLSKTNMRATQPRATSIDATMTCPSSLQSEYSTGQTTLESIKKNTGVVAGVVSQSSVVGEFVDNKSHQGTLENCAAVC